jgi:hypothetical protein
MCLDSQRFTFALFHTPKPAKAAPWQVVKAVHHTHGRFNKKKRYTMFVLSQKFIG